MESLADEEKRISLLLSILIRNSYWQMEEADSGGEEGEGKFPEKKQLYFGFRILIDLDSKGKTLTEFVPSITISPG